jgi:hypothetical protein
VNSSKLVKNLNADSVDGLSASSLGVSVREFDLPDASTQAVLDGLVAGSYLVSPNVEFSSASTGSCDVTVDSTIAAFFFGPSNGTHVVVSGTALLTVPSASSTVTILCSGNVISTTGFTSKVLLTPVAKLTSGSTS